LYVQVSQAYMNDFFGHDIGSRIAAHAGLSQVVAVVNSHDSDLFQAVASTHAADENKTRGLSTPGLIRKASAIGGDAVAACKRPLS
jgi:hypothetical protein